MLRIFTGYNGGLGLKMPDVTGDWGRSADDWLYKKKEAIFKRRITEARLNGYDVEKDFFVTYDGNICAKGKWCVIGKLKTGFVEIYYNSESVELVNEALRLRKTLLEHKVSINEIPQIKKVMDEITERHKNEIKIKEDEYGRMLELLK